MISNKFSAHKINQINIDGVWFYKVLLYDGDNIIMERFFRKKTTAKEFSRTYEKSFDSATVLLLAKLICISGSESDD